MRRGAKLAVAALACVAVAVVMLSCGDDDSPTGSGEPKTVTDIDGNVYATERIGARVWMAENLRVTHYRNGDQIPMPTYSWGFMTTPAACCYSNDTAIAAEYGLLYNWYAVNDSRGLAPEGWHIPSDSEWMELELHLGMDELALDSIGFRGTDEGEKLKEIGTAHWPEPNWGTDRYGFAATPGGYRDGTSGYFYTLGTRACWWSSTANEYDDDVAVYRAVGHSDRRISRSDWGPKATGFSVRCVRD